MPHTQVLHKEASIIHPGGGGFVDAVSWTSSYQFLTAPDDLEIVSDNAADSASGIGVQVVELTLLQLGATESEFQWYSHTVDVSMDGVNPVPVPDPPFGTGGKWMRCNWMTDGVTGSNNKNVGTITLNAVNGAQERLAQIDPGVTVDEQCIYTVPSDEITILTAASVALVDAKQTHDGIGRLFQQSPGRSARRIGTTNKVDSTRTTDNLPLGAFEFEPGTDLIWRIGSTAPASNIHARYAVARQQRSEVPTIGADQNL